MKLIIDVNDVVAEKPLYIRLVNAELKLDDLSILKDMLDDWCDKIEDKPISQNFN